MTQIKIDGWTLIDKDGAIVKTDQEYLSHKEEPYRIAGGRPPHKAGSTGKVWAFQTGSDLKDTHEFYPTVFDMRWVRDGHKDIKSGLSLVYSAA